MLVKSCIFETQIVQFRCCEIFQNEQDNGWFSFAHVCQSYHHRCLKKHLRGYNIAWLWTSPIAVSRIFHTLGIRGHIIGLAVHILVDYKEQTLVWSAEHIIHTHSLCLALRLMNHHITYWSPWGSFFRSTCISGWTGCFPPWHIAWQTYSTVRRINRSKRAVSLWGDLTWRNHFEDLSAPSCGWTCNYGINNLTNVTRFVLYKCL